MKRVKNILFGFDEENFSNQVIFELKRHGYEVNAEIRLSKASIRDFLRANEAFDTVVLLEVVSRPGSAGVEKFSAEELSLLTDDRDLNIIVVLNSNLKATNYMRTLYQASITSGWFQNGRVGPTPREIAQLAVRKRSRREALKYYDIDRKPAAFSVLEAEDLLAKVEDLNNPRFGSSIVERFIYVCNTLSQRQTASFIQKLPEDVLNELMLYDEFYIITDFLKKCGLDLKISRPKSVRIGLVKPAEAVRIEMTDPKTDNTDFFEEPTSTYQGFSIKRETTNIYGEAYPEEDMETVLFDMPDEKDSFADHALDEYIEEETASDVDVEEEPVMVDLGSFLFGGQPADEDVEKFAPSESSDTEIVNRMATDTPRSENVTPSPQMESLAGLFGSPAADKEEPEEPKEPEKKEETPVDDLLQEENITERVSLDEEEDEEFNYSELIKKKKEKAAHRGSRLKTRKSEDHTNDKPERTEERYLSSNVEEEMPTGEYPSLISRIAPIFCMVICVGCAALLVYTNFIR